jgi:hypothetical protein
LIIKIKLIAFLEYDHILIITSKAITIQRTVCMLCSSQTPNVLEHIIIWYPQYKPQHEQNDLGSNWLYGLFPPHVLAYVPNTLSFGDSIILRLWAWFFLKNCFTSLKTGTHSVPKMWCTMFPYIWWRKFINSLSLNVITILRIP